MYFALNEMGQKNCKLKPELVQELVHKTYCESNTCFSFARLFITNSLRQTSYHITLSISLPSSMYTFESEINLECIECVAAVLSSAFINWSVALCLYFQSLKRNYSNGKL